MTELVNFERRGGFVVYAQKQQSFIGYFTTEQCIDLNKTSKYR
jgi:hypothetical protein